MRFSVGAGPLRVYGGRGRRNHDGELIALAKMMFTIIATIFIGLWLAVKYTGIGAWKLGSFLYAKIR